MDLKLKDKVAIIGGASQGLGRACAEVPRLPRQAFDVSRKDHASLRE